MVGRLAGELAIMVVAAICFALLAPFGMSAIPFGMRLGMWLAYAVGGYLLFRPVVAAARLVAAHSPLSDWVALGLACAIAAMPMTVLVAVTLAGFRFGRIALNDLADLYPKVFLVGALVSVVQVLVSRWRSDSAAVEPAPELELEPAAISQPVPVAPDIPAPPEPSQRPRLLDRIAPGLGDELIALESEDHYVRVHTALGSALILMRLGDAVVEVAPVNGLRVHRSWWVARSGITKVHRRDRKLVLELVNGLEVAVARNAVADVREAGWLAVSPKAS